MTCVTRAPQSLDEWLSLVNNCAVAAGGADWPAHAIAGAQVLALVVLVLSLGVAVAWRR